MGSFTVWPNTETIAQFKGPASVLVQI